MNVLVLGVELLAMFPTVPRMPYKHFLTDLQQIPSFEVGVVDTALIAHTLVKIFCFLVGTFVRAVAHTNRP